MPLPKIAEIMEKHTVEPSKRAAQHVLAFEFVELVHGTDEANAVSWQHRQLFRPRSSTSEATPAPRPSQSQSPISGNLRSPYSRFINPQAGNKSALPTTFADMPSIRMTLPQSLVYNQSFNKVLLHAGMVSSKSEGHRLLTHGGAYVASRPSGIDGEMLDELTFVPIRNWSSAETEKYVVDGLLMLRMGKWKFKLIHVVGDEEFDKMAGQLPGWEQINNLRHLSEEDDRTREAKREQTRQLAAETAGSASVLLKPWDLKSIRAAEKKARGEKKTERTSYQRLASSRPAEKKAREEENTERTSYQRLASSGEVKTKRISRPAEKRARGEEKRKRREEKRKGREEETRGTSYQRLTSSRPAGKGAKRRVELHER